LTEGSKQLIELNWPGEAESVEIAGLDVGWGSEVCSFFLMFQIPYNDVPSVFHSRKNCCKK